MQPLQAVVKNDRIVLDQPTDLPEGEVVTLIVLEELLAEADHGDGEDADGEAPLFRFEIPQREYRKPKMMDARALLDELKSL